MSNRTAYQVLAQITPEEACPDVLRLRNGVVYHKDTKDAFGAGEYLEQWRKDAGLPEEVAICVADRQLLMAVYTLAQKGLTLAQLVATTTRHPAPEWMDELATAAMVMLGTYKEPAFPAMKGEE